MRTSLDFISLLADKSIGVYNVNIEGYDLYPNIQKITRSRAHTIIFKLWCLHLSLSWGLQTRLGKMKESPHIVSDGIPDIKVSKVSRYKKPKKKPNKQKRSVMIVLVYRLSNKYTVAQAYGFLIPTTDNFKVEDGSLLFYRREWNRCDNYSSYLFNNW